MKKENNQSEDFKNASEEIVLAALENLKDKGKEKNIPAILDLIMQTDHEGIRKGALDLMRDVKLKNAYKYVKEYIEKYRGHAHLPALVALCWEAGFNCDTELVFFTDLAVKEDYRVTLEVLTLVEHMSTAVSEADKTESLKLIENSNETDHMKKHLLVEIETTIKSL
jgi:hypothetical protein